MARILSFLIRYFSNYYILHRSDLAARAAPLDPRLSFVSTVHSRCYFSFGLQYTPINTLTANGELSRHGNLNFLWTWTLRWVTRSFATHASLCNTLPTNKLCQETVKIHAVKGLIYQKV